MPEPSPPEHTISEIRAAFANELLVLEIEQILTLRLVTDQMRKSAKYRQIAASIREVGVIEPPVVHPKGDGQFLLLDGHLRVDVLKGRGDTMVTCLVSLDDEAFTFNRHINRVTPIQENRMIVQAIDRGVSIERLAAALNMDVHHIVEKRDLLKGICPEAIDLLKDKAFTQRLFAVFRKMVPVRQIEAARLMIGADVYTESYALALLAATPKQLLVQPEVPKKVRSLDAETMARMEREMAGLQSDYNLVENEYAVDVVHFTFAKGYLTSLLNNASVVRYLTNNHRDILNQFRQLAEMTSLSAHKMADELPL